MLKEHREKWNGPMSEQTGKADAKSSGWRNRMTITVPEYAKIVGVGRNTAYESVRAGEVASIKVRGRVLVCMPALLRKLEGL
jgi:excisionase family DNA binding protein